MLNIINGYTRFISAIDVRGSYTGAEVVETLEGALPPTNWIVSA
jgi:hypothetical protein